MSKTMPAQKPFRSKQDYATPREFIDAVERDFGKLTWDLAATADTSVAGPSRFFGPGAHQPDAFVTNALATSWHMPGLLWLNPPYSNISDWARKCAEESQRGAKILFLVPASVGSNWFWDWVAPYACVYSLAPRLKFMTRDAQGNEIPACYDKHGRPTNYPKDLILAHYQSERIGFQRWQWKKARAA